MPDHGHDLRFGTFPTPAAADPAAVVALARRAETAGYDLVTFQDHPYNSGFLDTWTLMTWVAAATSRIRIAPNVLNLPLRPPAVLARAAASLDLLSDGRLDLGLGSGAFWDGIAAMTGRRLTPGEAVAALEEAIDILRALWDADDRTGVRREGTHYQLEGARRGPAPAHRIDIWLGAYKPRMLRLTGRLADGWLPSLPYLQPGDLARGNAVIDEAAHEAGRQPRDIRRLLNVGGRLQATSSGPLQGPAAQWIEELTAFALDDAVDTFIVMGDDVASLERLAGEVIPAVREQVAAERARRAGSSDEAPMAAAAPATVPVGVADATPQDTGRSWEQLGITPTPDDGRRLSRMLRWDERTRPAGPARDPALRYTAQGGAAGQHLIDVHDHLRRELATVRDIVRQVREGQRSAADARSDLATMTLRQNDWIMGAYCASYCRTVTTHHGIEDESILPYLRRVDEPLRPVLDRLEEEHRVIHGVIEEVDAALVAWVSEPGDGSTLDAAIASLTDTLLSHLAYEEQQLVEPLARHGFYAGQL